MLETLSRPQRSSRWLASGVTVSLLILIGIGTFIAGHEIRSSDSVFDLTYGFGPVIRGLIENGCTCTPNRNFGWMTYATRMPLIPILGAASYFISPNQIAFFVLKNIFFWSIWIYALLRLRREYSLPNTAVLCIIWLMILAPYNLSIGSKVDVEEGYLLPFIALLFVLLLTSRAAADFVVVGVVVGCVYLTKSSMLPVCLLVLLWMGARAVRERKPALGFIPVAILALAICGWGAYTYKESGVFAVGANASSWNGWNLYKGNNKRAYDLYPRKNLDSLDYEDEVNRLLPRTPAQNEWELNDAQRALGKEFIQSNGATFLKMAWKKLGVALFDPKESPEFIDGYDRPAVVVSSVVNHLLFDGVIILSIWNLCRRRNIAAALLTLIFAATYILPYFLGFLYTRHMVPLYSLAGFSLAIQLWNRLPD